MRKPGCDAAAERVSDDNRRPGVEGAGRAPRLARLADELAKIVSLAPIRAPHAAERRRDNAPLAGEERGDEAPPVRVGGSAVQEDETRLAARAPGEGFDLRAIDRDERALGLDRDDALEPMPAPAASAREKPRAAPWGSIRARRSSFEFRRLRTARPRPCRRRRTSSRRHSCAPRRLPSISAWPTMRAPVMP